MEKQAAYRWDFNIKNIVLVACTIIFGLIVFNQSASADQMKVTPGYYAPYGSISENIECKIGYAPSQRNMKNGKCRVNWNTVANNVTNNVINSGISGGLWGHLP